MVRKSRKDRANGSKRSFNFIEPLEYNLVGFGEKEKDVKVYNLHLSVAQLHSSFKVFEDLNNVQDWPISALIQRELDHKRATQICDDYLMGDGNTKYFPPLIAVLIPTDEEYRPEGAFGEPDEESLKRFRSTIEMSGKNYEEEGFLEPVQLYEGFNLVPLDGYQGDLSWDGKKLSAVVIDGQHRYKALQKAVERNKSFDEWLLNVTLIDLQPICKETGKTPTEVARDLFVTINHTPVEVDETRLVLMDDRDLLATSTQVLVDDSDEENEPACPPELIDWECEGGKHNVTNSITGVLVLRQVILHSVFNGQKLSSVDDRTNSKLVKRWMCEVNNLLDIDELIGERLGKSETLSYRYESALEAADAHDDDEEDYFLFSYSVKVSKILKEQFKSLYLSSFKSVYHRLTPFSDLLALASQRGVLDPAKDINRYYRAFKGKREELKSDKILKGEVDKYEKEFFELTANKVFNTVMGQKAVFEVLFSKYIAFVEEFDENEILSSTSDFIDDFNALYRRLERGGAVDERFFCINYTIPKKRGLSDALGLVTDFWKGIIIKNNGDIDYAKAGVSMLSNIVWDISSYYRGGGEFVFSQKNKMVRRHISILRKMGLDDTMDSDEIESLAEKIVDYKESHVGTLLEKADN